MKSFIAAFVFASSFVVSSVPSFAAERLTDKQVKATVENIDRGFDRWKDSLERRNLDDAVIRNAAGTVDVRRFLDDFEKEIHVVKDRVKPEYSADAEVTTLLRRASDVERRARAGQAQPEWQAMSAQFSALAGAYGTTFPLPSGDATAARLTDNEVAKRLEDVEQQAKRLTGEADKAMKQAKATDAERAKAKQSLGALSASAKQTREMVKAGTATSTQAAALLAAAGNAKGLLGGLPMAAPGTAAWGEVDRNVGALAGAFGQSW